MQAPLQTDTDARNAAKEKLWNVRLKREARAAEHYAKIQERPNLPFALFEALLRVTGLYARGVRNAADIRVTRVTLRYAHLPDALAGFRVLHLSDFHLPKDAPLDRLCNVLSGLECDVCAMTGDYAYTGRRQHEYLPGLMKRVAEAIPSVHGIYAVLGNHDHAADVERLHAAGIRTLINQGQAIAVGDESVWLAGVDDPHDFRTHDLRRAFDGAPHNAFKILLAHSPELVEEATAFGAGLYLCGHTHGGQLCLPWGPVFLNIRCPRRYGWGTWKHDDMWGITTAGLGATALPVRYNCPPEVVLIELAKE